MKFSASTTKSLGYYVYALVDPIKKSIFYIGKASANNRAFDHLRSTKGEDDKDKRIQSIRALGFEPGVEILRYGLQNDEASFEVEAAVIDAIGIENLTNKVRGHGVNRGRQSSIEVERLHGSKSISIEEISESYMLFFIKNTYSPTKSETELYDSTRQFWYSVSPKTRFPATDSQTLPYATALAIVDSIVVRAYSIVAWFPAGTTHSTRIASDLDGRDWEFVGQLIQNHKLLGKRLQKNGTDLPANQLGYGYVN
jgi:uncharacterized protein